MKTASSTDCSRMVEGIRAGELAATEGFYEAFQWVRAYFATHLGPQEAEDRFHDVVMIVISCIRKGALKEPARLAGYVKGVAYRLVADRVREEKRSRERERRELWYSVADPAESAEGQAIRSQLRTLAMQMLEELSWRDRAVLVGFYIEEQRPDEICSALGLTGTQFRLVKTRAKARLGALIRKWIRHQNRIHVHSGRAQLA